MPKSPPLVFIDTNVWFSAFYGSENAEKLIKAHIDGKIKAVISRKVLTELTRNIKGKIPQALPNLKKFLEAAPPIVLKDPLKISQNVKKSVNQKDRIIFQSALDAKIPLFVTGNLKDFNALTKVISPKKALGILKLS